MERELNGYEYFGIGETGIDLYWDPSTYDMQLESLKIHCRWASEKKLPIILHTRNANEQVISFFENCKTKPAKGIFHCFSGTLDEIKRIDQLGDYYFGIGGVITYKNAGLFELIPQIPIQKIVVETDSPYLAPVPHRGKKNEPAFILHVIEKLAQALKINLQECKKILFENTNRLFSN
jgi:TatD DNase family protein